MYYTIYDGGGCGYNPFDWMHWLQREPQGATVHFWGNMRITAVAIPMGRILGHHVRVGIEDNLWNSKRERMSTVKQIEAVRPRFRIAWQSPLRGSRVSECWCSLAS